jgi:hypothetical protein
MAHALPTPRKKIKHPYGVLISCNHFGLYSLGYGPVQKVHSRSTNHGSCNFILILKILIVPLCAHVYLCEGMHTTHTHTHIWFVRSLKLCFMQFYFPFEILFVHLSVCIYVCVYTLVRIVALNPMFVLKKIFFQPVNKYTYNTCSMHMHAHTLTPMHTCIHARTHARTHARARARAHTHTHTHTHTRTHTHVHRGIVYN